MKKIKWVVYIWHPAAIETKSMPEVAWDSDSSGHIFLSKEELGEWIFNYPKMKICFNVADHEIYIDNKMFRQR
jgi:hypothetical protein